ncbi:MAG: response regulator transcription factor [Thermoflavifilum sp.]|nr:response regulator transcription factor [Thermoflavifilum sp.]MCL6514280.1 LytTR family DNA-binding domain-containing protein [Alicyclobacillus sp.]
MRPIRALVAEDEWVAREELVYLLRRAPDIELCPPATTGSEALEGIWRWHPHVVFLDIHMPGPSGMEIAQEVMRQRTGDLPLVVFITAYDTYAVDAFAVEAVDYLLKPYDEERLRQTLERIRRHPALADAHTGEAPSAAYGMPPQSSGIRLWLHQSEGWVVLPPAQICFAERTDRYVEVHTMSEVVRVRTTLHELEERLASPVFFRCHKSFLVNLEQVREVQPWVNGAYTLIMADPARTTVPVSRTFAKELRQRLRQLAR